MALGSLWAGPMYRPHGQPGEDGGGDIKQADTAHARVCSGHFWFPCASRVGAEGEGHSARPEPPRGASRPPLRLACPGPREPSAQPPVHRDIPLNATENNYDKQRCLESKSIIATRARDRHATRRAGHEIDATG